MDYGSLEFKWRTCKEGGYAKVDFEGNKGYKENKGTNRCTEGGHIEVRHSYISSIYHK